MVIAYIVTLTAFLFICGAAFKYPQHFREYMFMYFQEILEVTWNGVYMLGDYVIDFMRFVKARLK